MNPVAKTINVGYVCDMSAYGGGTTTTPVNMSASVSAPTSVAAGGSAAVSFSAQTITLPASVASNAEMQKVAAVSFSTTVPVTDAGTSEPPVTLKSAAPIAVTAGALPAMAAVTGNVSLPKAGTALVEQPQTVQIAPVDAQGKALPTITCTVPNAAVVSISITVTAPPPPPVTLPSGPVYTCTLSANGKKLETQAFIVVMSLRVAGKLTTGSTDQVTLVSPPGAQGGFGGPYLAPISKVIFQGSLPVTGAQQGSIPLFRATADVALTTFKVAGSLFLSQPGTISIHLPQAFTFTEIISGGQGVIACTSKASPSPVGLTLKVTGNAIQPPSPQGSGTPVPSGTPAPSGTPVGAPNTGGGGPASSMPLVAGGAALLAVGAGLAFAARRRRRVAD